MNEAQKSSVLLRDPPVTTFESDCCAICHDDFNDKVYLKCGHPYCKSCIENWLIMSNICPLCGVNAVDKQ
jgi:E3 ubiquitin-protein ligase Arkadia